MLAIKQRRRWLLALVGLTIFCVIGFFLMPESVVQLLRRDSTWQTMQTTGRWRVGMDPSFPPFEWLDDNGRAIGYDVELARTIAERWELELEIVPIGFDSLGDAVQTGRVNSVISALPYDERLTRDIAYSPPYFDAGLVLTTREASTITTVADLAGERVAVEWGSLGDMVGRRLQREDESILLERFESPDAAVAALLDQTVDALLIDHITLRMEQVNGAPLVQAGPLLESNPYVIAMPVSAHQLQRATEEVLVSLQTEGVLHELETKWFRTE